ncbi:MAG: hypothetical protein AzoDbin1_03801 [Azoarcus sp.]|nr:hypothetical protein [Azoarcus sp.]
MQKSAPVYLGQSLFIVRKNVLSQDNRVARDTPGVQASLMLTQIKSICERFRKCCVQLTTA